MYRPICSQDDVGIIYIADNGITFIRAYLVAEDWSGYTYGSVHEISAVFRRRSGVITRLYHNVTSPWRAYSGYTAEATNYTNYNISIRGYGYQYNRWSATVIVSEVKGG